MAQEYKNHETPGIQVPVIYTKLQAPIDFSQCSHLPENNEDLVHMYANLSANASDVLTKTANVRNVRYAR